MPGPAGPVRTSSHRVLLEPSTNNLLGSFDAVDALNRAAHPRSDPRDHSLRQVPRLKIGRVVKGPARGQGSSSARQNRHKRHTRGHGKAISARKSNALASPYAEHLSPKSPPGRPRSSSNNARARRRSKSSTGAAPNQLSPLRGGEIRRPPGRRRSSTASRSGATARLQEELEVSHERIRKLEAQLDRARRTAAGNAEAVKKHKQQSQEIRRLEDARARSGQLQHSREVGTLQEMVNELALREEAAREEVKQLRSAARRQERLVQQLGEQLKLGSVTNAGPLPRQPLQGDGAASVNEQYVARVLKAAVQQATTLKATLLTPSNASASLAPSHSSPPVFTPTAPLKPPAGAGRGVSPRRAATAKTSVVQADSWLPADVKRPVVHTAGFKGASPRAHVRSGRSLSQPSSPRSGSRSGALTAQSTASAVGAAGVVEEVSKLAVFQVAVDYFQRAHRLGAALREWHHYGTAMARALDVVHMRTGSRVVKQPEQPALDITFDGLAKEQGQGSDGEGEGGAEAAGAASASTPPPPAATHVLMAAAKLLEGEDEQAESKQTADEAALEEVMAAAVPVNDAAGGDSVQGSQRNLVQQSEEDDEEEEDFNWDDDDDDIQVPTLLRTTHSFMNVPDDNVAGAASVDGDEEGEVLWVGLLRVGVDGKVHKDAHRRVVVQVTGFTDDSETHQDDSLLVEVFDKATVQSFSTARVTRSWLASKLANVQGIINPELPELREDAPRELPLLLSMLVVVDNFRRDSLVIDALTQLPAFELDEPPVRAAMAVVVEAEFDEEGADEEDGDQVPRIANTSSTLQQDGPGESKGVWKGVVPVGTSGLVQGDAHRRLTVMISREHGTTHGDESKEPCLRIAAFDPITVQSFASVAVDEAAVRRAAEKRRRARVEAGKQDLATELQTELSSIAADVLLVAVVVDDFRQGSIEYDIDEQVPLFEL